MDLLIGRSFRSLPGTHCCFPRLSRKLSMPSDRCLCSIADPWLLLSERWAAPVPKIVAFSMSCDPAIQPKAKLVGAFAGTHIAVVQHTTMRSIMTAMKRSLFALALTLIAAGTAHAQRGHISDGGRMPETMFPVAQPPPSMPH